MRKWAFLIILMLGLLVDIGCSTQSSAKRKNFGEAHYKLGLSYLNNNQNQQAFVEFQKSIESDPKNRDSHYALGHIYFQQDRLNKAEMAFKETLKLDRKFSEAYNYLGKVYERKGDTKNAILYYRRALKNPKYSTPHFTHYNLGLSLIKEEDTDAALLAFEEALRIEPLFMPARLARGEALNQLERHDEAIKAYSHALDLEPDNPQGHFGLGVALYKGGSKPQAKISFEKALELSPDGNLAEDSKRYLDLLR